MSRETPTGWEQKRSKGNHLEELIATMSGQERRAFRRRASSPEGERPIYLALFEFLVADPEAGPERTISALGYHGTKGKRAYAVARHNLYSRLLAFLIEQNRAERRFASIDQILMLAERGLTRHAERLLIRELERAKEREDFAALIGLTEIGWGLLLSHSSSPETFERLSDQLLTSGEEATAEMRDLIEMRRLTARIRMERNRYEKSEGGRKSSTKRLETLLKHPLLRTDPGSRSIRFQLFYYNLRGTLFHYLGHDQDAYHEKERGVELGMIGLERGIGDPVGLATNIRNLANSMITTGRFEELATIIEELRKRLSVWDSGQADRRAIYGELALVELQRLIRSGALGRKKIPEWIGKTVKEFRSSLRPSTLFHIHFMIAVVYGLQRHFVELLQQTDRLFRDHADVMSAVHRRDLEVLRLIGLCATGEFERADRSLRKIEKQNQELKILLHQLFTSSERLLPEISGDGTIDHATAGLILLRTYIDQSIGRTHPSLPELRRLAVRLRSHLPVRLDHSGNSRHRFNPIVVWIEDVGQMR